MKFVNKKIVYLIFVGILLVNVNYSFALKSTKTLEAADGARVYFSAEIESVQLNTGDHFIIISIQLAELGEASGTKDFRVDYRLGSHFEDFVGFDGYMSSIMGSKSENVTIPFKKVWDGVDLEMKLSFTSYTWGQDLFAISDWLVFFTFYSSEEGASMNLSLIVLPLIVIAIFSTIRKKSRSRSSCD